MSKYLPLIGIALAAAVASDASAQQFRSRRVRLDPARSSPATAARVATITTAIAAPTIARKARGEAPRRSEALGAAQELRPRRREARREYERTNQVDKARDCYEEILRLVPTYTPAADKLKAIDRKGSDGRTADVRRLRQQRLAGRGHRHRGRQADVRSKRADRGR